MIYQPDLAAFFKLQIVSVFQISVAAGVGFCCVIWFEIYKYVLRLKSV